VRLGEESDGIREHRRRELCQGEYRLAAHPAHSKSGRNGKKGRKKGRLSRAIFQFESIQQPGMGSSIGGGDA
jgi:hypothetical protein